jgi:hypothetical protein
LFLNDEKCGTNTAVTGGLSPGARHRLLMVMTMSIITIMSKTGENAAAVTQLVGLQQLDITMPGVARAEASRET